MRFEIFGIDTILPFSPVHHFLLLCYDLIKVKIKLFFIFFLFIFFTASKIAIAATLLVTPETGNYTTNFTLTASGFSPPDIYVFCAYKIGGATTDYRLISTFEPSSTSQSFSKSFTPTNILIDVLGAGNYEIRVSKGYICNNPPYLISTGFSLQGSSISPPNCNNICDPNRQNLVQYKCPDSCPCQKVGTEWTCKEVNWAYPNRITCVYHNSTGINTALGCIPADDLTSFIGWVLKIIIPIASGIAFLLMASGAIQILTSAGDPKKVQAGQELITSALSGLLFIILALFLLKLIGVDILRIPDFAKPFG